MARCFSVMWGAQSARSSWCLGRLLQLPLLPATWEVSFIQVWGWVSHRESASKTEVTFGNKWLEQQSIISAVFCLLDTVARARLQSSGGYDTGACSPGGWWWSHKNSNTHPSSAILESLDCTLYPDVTPLCVGVLIRVTVCPSFLHYTQAKWVFFIFFF